MNERIQELAEQAGFYVAGNKIYIPSTSEDITSCQTKFAELIVAECISVMKSTVDESIDFERKLDETSSWIESDIKEHFGVEE